MSAQVTAIGKRSVRVAAAIRSACRFGRVVNAAAFVATVRHRPKAGSGYSVHRVALPARDVRRCRAFARVRLTHQGSAMACFWFALRAAVLRRAVSSSGRPIRRAVPLRCTAGRQDKQFAGGARSTCLVWPSPSTILRYSQPPLVSATNAPPPNLTLQPTRNGMPPRLASHGLRPFWAGQPCRHAAAGG